MGLRSFWQCDECPIVTEPEDSTFGGGQVLPHGWSALSYAPPLPSRADASVLPERILCGDCTLRVSVALTEARAERGLPDQSATSALRCGNCGHTRMRHQAAQGPCLIPGCPCVGVP